MSCVYFWFNLYCRQAVISSNEISSGFLYGNKELSSKTRIINIAKSISALMWLRRKDGGLSQTNDKIYGYLITAACLRRMRATSIKRQVELIIDLEISCRTADMMMIM